MTKKEYLSCIAYSENKIQEINAEIKILENRKKSYQEYLKEIEVYKNE